MANAIKYATSVEKVFKHWVVEIINTQTVIGRSGLEYHSQRQKLVWTVPRTNIKKLDFLNGNRLWWEAGVREAGARIKKEGTSKNVRTAGSSRIT